MTIEEKDKYIADHLMKLTDETLRFMVADLNAENIALKEELFCKNTVALMDECKKYATECFRLKSEIKALKERQFASP